MGDEAEARINFLQKLPTGRQIMKELMCIHEIIAEWCATCKHDNPASIRVVLQQENLKIAENLDKWQKPRTT